MIIQNNNLFTTANTTQGTSTVTGSVTTGGTTTSEVQYIATFSTNGPSTHQQVTSSTDRIMIFTYAGGGHTFTVPSGGLVCDILMIGGGGKGGSSNSGGGGAGACIVAINQTLPAGSCVVNVGVGQPGTDYVYSSGGDSYITAGGTILYLARGGGKGGTDNGGQENPDNGALGGCGGGAGRNPYNTGQRYGGGAAATNVVNGVANISPGFTSSYVVYGFKGGDQFQTASTSGSSTIAGAGGGGIGGAGFNHNIGVSQGSAGGPGRHNANVDGTIYVLRNHFANGGNGFGVLHADNNYYIGGGGGGETAYDFNYSAPGGIGGGGSGLGNRDGGINRILASSGTPNTGSGGGAGSGYGEGNGGSGIIIIRYKYRTITETVNTTVTTTTYTHQPTTTTTLSTPTLGTPSIELVRGTQGDSNTDYKIGNYNGDFIVKSSANGVDTDYIRIVGTSASIFNSTASPQWSTVSDRRIKENIEKASYDKCFDTINKLELYRFNYIKELNNNNKDKTQLGYIAQEVNDVFPKAVSSYEFNNTMLSIPDLLSIDIAQINYSLYGAVKKLIEINKDKEVRLKKLESILNIECDSSNIAIIKDTITSNVVIVEDTITSNIVIEGTITSNIVIEEAMTSNV